MVFIHEFSGHAWELIACHKVNQGGLCWAADIPFLFGPIFPAAAHGGFSSVSCMAYTPLASCPHFRA
jgi:hypothetical protein